MIFFSIIEIIFIVIMYLRLNMYPFEQLEKNRKAQNIAKETLEELKPLLKVGMSEKDFQ